MSTKSPNQTTIQMDREQALQWARRQSMLPLIFLTFYIIMLTGAYIATGVDSLALTIGAAFFWAFGALDACAKITDGRARRLMDRLYNWKRDTPYPWTAFDLEVTYNDEH